jgi:hypothetical protein
MSLWRSTLERKHGRDVAHKTIKVWRALWTVMRGMKIARGTDPSAGVRNKKPKPRHARWSEGEAVRLVKAAWRHGYHGLACIIAVAWDTQFSPIDVRTLAARHRAAEGDRLLFDRQEQGRTKSGRPAIGTLSRRTERLLAAYQKKLGAELHPDAILFRNRSKAPYREDTLHSVGDGHVARPPGLACVPVPVPVMPECVPTCVTDIPQPAETHVGTDRD